MMKELQHEEREQGAHRKEVERARLQKEYESFLLHKQQVEARAAWQKQDKERIATETQDRIRKVERGRAVARQVDVVQSVQSPKRPDLREKVQPVDLPPETEPEHWKMLYEAEKKLALQRERELFWAEFEAKESEETREREYHESQAEAKKVLMDMCEERGQLADTEKALKARAKKLDADARDMANAVAQIGTQLLAEAAARTRAHEPLPHRAIARILAVALAPVRQQDPDLEELFRRIYYSEGFASDPVRSSRGKADWAAAADSYVELDMKAVQREMKRDDPERRLCMAVLRESICVRLSAGLGELLEEAAEQLRRDPRAGQALPALWSVAAILGCQGEPVLLEAPTGGQTDRAEAALLESGATARTAREHFGTTAGCTLMRWLQLFFASRRVLRVVSSAADPASALQSLNAQAERAEKEGPEAAASAAEKARAQCLTLDARGLRPLREQVAAGAADLTCALAVLFGMDLPADQSQWGAVFSDRLLIAVRHCDVNTPFAHDELVEICMGAPAPAHRCSEILWRWVRAMGEYRLAREESAGADAVSAIVGRIAEATSPRKRTPEKQGKSDLLRSEEQYARRGVAPVLNFT